MGYGKKQCLSFVGKHRLNFAYALHYALSIMTISSFATNNTNIKVILTQTMASMNTVAISGQQKTQWAQEKMKRTFYHVLDQLEGRNCHF